MHSRMDAKKQFVDVVGECHWGELCGRANQLAGPVGDSVRVPACVCVRGKGLFTENMG